MTVGLFFFFDKTGLAYNIILSDRVPAGRLFSCESLLKGEGFAPNIFPSRATLVMDCDSEA